MKTKVLIFTLKKAVEVVLTLFLVTMLSFILMRISPVDAATAYVQRNTQVVTQDQITSARIKMGLDKPLAVQYGNWISGIFRGDFGNSLYDGRLVTKKLSESLPTTLSIVGLATLIMAFGIVFVGILAYVFRKNIVGQLILILSVMGISIPPFCIAIGYIDVFAVKLGVMSVQGNEGVQRYLPAALCLSVLGIALYSQMLAKGIERQMKEDWAIYARCRGMTERKILWCHALPNATAEILPSFMQILGLFVAGSCVVESVFSLPGLGNQIVFSVINRDSTMLHAQMLVMASVFVFCSLVSDVLQLLLDKRKVGT